MEQSVRLFLHLTTKKASLSLGQKSVIWPDLFPGRRTGQWLREGKGRCLPSAPLALCSLMLVEAGAEHIISPAEIYVA